jgi:hypothetical protein
MGFCSNNCPTHKGRDSFSHTHKTETKRTIKIKKTSKTVLRKTKEGEKKTSKKKDK